MDVLSIVTVVAHSYAEYLLCSSVETIQDKLGKQRKETKGWVSTALFMAAGIPFQALKTVYSLHMNPWLKIAISSHFFV